MRTCYIERLDCERKVPYDPDDHTALERDGFVETEIVTVDKGLLQIRAVFEYKILGRDDEKLWGKVKGSAIVTVRDTSIEPAPDGKAAKIGPTIGAVIQGALQDDIFLAVTHVLRAMHLPGMLFLPAIDKPAQKANGEKAKPAPAS